MHLEDEPGLRADRRRIVILRRTVRRADLTQPRPGRFQQVRQPETVADLHHLAAADDDLAPGGERGGGQHERRRTVVDHVHATGRRDRAGQGGERRPPPAGPFPGRQVQLDVGVPAGRDDRVDRGRGERGPPEVGVQDDACRVEHGPQPARGPRQRRHRRVRDPSRVEVPRPRPLLGRADSVLDRPPPEPPGRGAQPRIRQDRVSTGNLTPSIH